jgi:phage N-6-adenine-methyltransferase
MINHGLRSSKSDTWETPRALFAGLDAEFGFTLDVCALPGNAKCARYYTPEDDGLAQPWHGVAFCNPPYGRKLIHWIRKAAESARAGATVVCLFPARTDTSWFHDIIVPNAEVRFLRGRLYFGPGEDLRAPFPSAVAIFRPPLGPD